MSTQFKKFDFENELSAQRELFKECFPECIGTPIISEKHYNWKFHSKKGEIQSAEYVACAENEILGYYAAIPYYYSFQGKVMTAAMVCDVMTGVKARGKGIFTKLGIYSTNEFAKQGLDFTTGYPIRKEVIPGHIKAGWEQYFELPLFGRFIKFNSFLKKKRLGFLAPFINVLFSFWTSILNLFFLPRNRNLIPDTSTSDKIDSIDGLTEFYKKWENETQISLIKDIDFLKWRLGAPEKSYHIVTLRDQNTIVGVLIAREVEKEGVLCMGILDLALLKDYHKYAYLLTNELIKIAKHLGSELLNKVQNIFLFPAIGDNNIRRKVINILIENNLSIATAVHPKANISNYSEIKEGTLICQGVCINPFAKIGKGVIINTSSIIEHECNISDYVHIAPGAVLAGNVFIGENSFIGANAVIKQGIKIGENVFVGAGSVILNDISDNETWVGNPAKNIEKNR